MLLDLQCYHLTIEHDLAYAKLLNQIYVQFWQTIEMAFKINCRLNLDLDYEKSSNKLILKGYVYADFVSDKDKIKSATAYFFTLGDNLITWKSKLQSIMTLSSTNADMRH